METTIRISSEDTIQFLFTKYFKEHLIDLSYDPAANFALQRIVERLTKPEDVDSVVCKILYGTLDLICMNVRLSCLILDESKVSVITAVLDACTRTNTLCNKARQVFSILSLLKHRPLLRV
jgi:hypothetical protein